MIPKTFIFFIIFYYYFLLFIIIFYYYFKRVTYVNFKQKKMYQPAVSFYLIEFQSTLSV